MSEHLRRRSLCVYVASSGDPLTCLAICSGDWAFLDRWRPVAVYETACRFRPSRRSSVSEFDCRLRQFGFGNFGEGMGGVGLWRLVVACLDVELDRCARLRS